MDMVTCVARRTRSRTESYLNSILNQAKGGSRAKRHRKSVPSEDDDIIEIVYPQPQGNHVQEDRVCDFAVNAEDSSEETSSDSSSCMESDAKVKKRPSKKVDTPRKNDLDHGFAVNVEDLSGESGSDSFYVESDVKVKKRPSKKVVDTPRKKKKNDLDHVFELLTKSIWQRSKTSEDETATREDATISESHSKNPWEGQEPVNLRFGCEEEPEPVEKTEEEREIERLWEEMALALALEGLQQSSSKDNGDVSSCIHALVLDEEIGLKCSYCSYVAVQIRDISPAMDKYHANNVDDKKTYYNDKKGKPLLNGFDEFEGGSDQSRYVSISQGTVWEYIPPSIKDSLYPHQQQGFEFIWKNLAGTTKLDEFKKREKSGGGCIISHSPGTGKTRLTIVFLQSYLERFPDSHPVVIAPASILLTWEQEFRKWNADIPFYNMNSLELSGNEDQSAVSLLVKGDRSNKRSVRMVKLYSWSNKKSVLGISYHLYEKLAREGEFSRMLLELPGLLVLDEGHTARNQSSCIWKVLTQVKTEKRIILSGTPFQNNFKELSNVLGLAKPAFTDSISSRLQDLSKWSNNGKFYEETGIMELRAMIAPFVHVYKKNVNLPGLRECVVVLNPPYQQRKILSRIDLSQNTFELEHKLSAISVHPSLYLQCNPTTKEDFYIGPATLKILEKLRLDYKEGVKTRFLIDFIRLSDIVKEKVLVFSQYIDTLMLIRDQLSACFGWTEGEETLLMYGKVEQKDRQHQIDDFNKPDSKSKVLLASTRACSEGIHLVGASRVIFLDVVWNPAVEMQAKSRAYRIGQKRVVYIYHLMVKDTSEWEKYCKQTEKHHISELVFSSTNEKGKVISKEVVSEDRILDKMVRHEKQKDMFDEIRYHPKESACLPTSSD